MNSRTLRRISLLLLASLLSFGCASVPEVGLLLDRKKTGRVVVIKLSEQKAYLYRNGELTAVSPVSTGREGYSTPTGKFKVIQKDRRHRSSLYGQYVKNGRVVRANVDIRKTPKPPGATFVGAPMPYFLRFSGAHGLHAGNVPRYPASHGCVRLPARYARRFFYAVKIGTPVIVQR